MKQTCAQLVADFEERRIDLQCEKLSFTGVGDRDVYNITAPFFDEGEMVIAGRVEARETEQSEVVFFVNRDGTWIPRPDSPTFQLQDPFVARVSGELVFGGVETCPDPRSEGGLIWRTNFYRGKNIASLKKFASGPIGMKDIRLTELPDGKIGVFTRPQGEIGGRGKIGFMRINSLGDLKQAPLHSAPLFDQFVDAEWGGANEIHILDNGLLGVLGHIACFGPDQGKNYYPMVFALNPETLVPTPMKVILTRDCLPAGPAKRPDLVNVIFSGGLVRKEDGTAELYAGVSDAEAHRAIIPDPFVEYEKSENIARAM